MGNLRSSVTPISDGIAPNSGCRGLLNVNDPVRIGRHPKFCGSVENAPCRSFVGGTWSHFKLTHYRTRGSVLICRFRRLARADRPGPAYVSGMRRASPLPTFYICPCPQTDLWRIRAIWPDGHNRQVKGVGFPTTRECWMWIRLCSKPWISAQCPKGHKSKTKLESPRRVSKPA
jgi:hypothetical protein